jgi:hypothetical protein
MELNADARSMKGEALGERIRQAVGRLRRLLRPAPRQFQRTLENAEYLLNHAPDAGIVVEPDVAQRIVSAKRSGKAPWDGPGAGTLIADMSKLAAKVGPITDRDTLCARQNVRAQICKYTWVAIGSYAAVRTEGSSAPPMSSVDFLLSLKVQAPPLEAVSLRAREHARRGSSDDPQVRQ